MTPTTTSRLPVVDAANRSVYNEQVIAEFRAADIALLGRTILISSSAVFSPFGFEESLRELVRLQQSIDSWPDDLLTVRNYEDIETAIASRRTGVYIYFQSPEPIANQMWRLDLFRSLGLRVLQMTYNQRSLLGDGCSEATDGGLSELGEAVIGRSNEIGVTLDVAHSGRRTTLETIEHSSQPVLLSHTGAKALHDHPRCKTDEELVACSQKGGVVGVAGMASLLAANSPTIETFLDHVEYIVNLVGVEHVGLGLDFITGHEQDDFSLLGYKPEMYQESFNTGIANPVVGLESIKDVNNITDGLRSRGLAESDLVKILGTNLMRVFKQTWLV